jgi:hypothetical protein
MSQESPETLVCECVCEVPRGEKFHPALAIITSFFCVSYFRNRLSVHTTWPANQRAGGPPL